MEFFSHRTQIDFLGLRQWTWTFSALLILLSCVSLMTRGINWGLDFTGGYAVQVHFQSTPEIPEVRQALTKKGLEGENIVTFGSSQNLMLTFSPQAALNQDDLAAEIKNALPQAHIVELNYMGSEVGAELAQTGILAMVVAIIAIMIYIAFRFEFKFAISAALALAHDPIIILGVFSLFQLPFDLTALAAILAVIGYSLNDTVVVYDRIRENLRLMRATPIHEVVNRAINDTLSRTIMTSGLTFIVLLILFILGGPSIHYFALALMIGVVVGTYSSIYIAGALAVFFGLKRDAFMDQGKVVDTLP